MRSSREIGEGLLADMDAGVVEKSRNLRQFAETLIKYEFTREELKKIYDHTTMLLLVDGTAEDRREVLATMDTCPCCDRWLGHNKPPADDVAESSPYRRQKTFDFDR
jgi:hypothetical protein